MSLNPTSKDLIIAISEEFAQDPNVFTHISDLIAKEDPILSEFMHNYANSFEDPYENQICLQSMALMHYILSTQSLWDEISCIEQQDVKEENT